MQFEREVKKKIANFYIFYGKEKFLKEEGIAMVKEKLADAFYTEYDVDNQFSVQELISNLSSDVLFNDTNLIILKNADIMTAELLEPLKTYHKAPNPNSVLIMELTKLDNRSKFAKAVKNLATCVECSPLYDRPKPWLRLPPWESDLAKWVCSRVRKYKKTLAPEAAFFLTEYVGNDLKSLDSQLQKIALFLQDKKDITLEDIEKLVGKSKKINIFDLLDAISHKKLDTSLNLMRQVFANGLQEQDGSSTHDPMHIGLKILRLLHYRFKQIWQLGISGDSSSIGEYAKRQVSGFTKNFTKKQLISIWQFLLETELRMKTSRVSPIVSIEQVIIHITSGQL
ncbi:DNA polymerase III subunit delta [Candidatus Uabimicrobium sp. HlEnr_7]|uniref:DNA polymerase III subunit delta n=1 Tax=Candidatus Uabimicrobium helgolandensis TaxID=3095367 RepID=UPI003558F158